MKILDSNIIDQVRQLFSTLTSKYTFKVKTLKDSKSEELISFLDEIAECSDNINVNVIEDTNYSLNFTLLKNDEETGVSFTGIPNGHEFSSLLLSVLNSEGKGKNLPDEVIVKRIQALKGNISLKTYVSLTCTNCPDVVQALNVLALLNKNISHNTIDGAVVSDEVKELNIQAVPAVFADGELIHVGRGTLGELLQKLEDKYGVNSTVLNSDEKKEYDVLVLGGGPAGASSAIYSARKGLKVAVVAGRIGGQVKETVGIENLISTPKTTGSELADNLRLHLEDYPIDIFDNREIESVNLKSSKKEIIAKGGEKFISSSVIIATGASWRRLNVPGENEYIGKGVAFCPHCDGPLFKDKEVAVIGGGNSGIEAAIDLAGICSKVTVIEFAETLKADNVLVEKAKSLSNVNIITNSATTQIIGDGNKVTSIMIKDRADNKEEAIVLDGIFVQIGLAANSIPFKDELGTTRIGEIVIDEHCRTNLPGVYAAGDVSSVPYKQIIIAMGEGAKAALTAFDDRIRELV